MIAAFDLILGRWLGVPGLDGVALLVVVMAELGSMFGLAAVGLLAQRRHELQAQPHPIDRLAYAQVAALTDAAREMRGQVAERDDGQVLAAPVGRVTSPSPAAPLQPGLAPVSWSGLILGLSAVD